MEKMNEIGKIFTIFVTITVTILIAGIITFNVSQAQELTPEQKQAMCDPSNPKLNFVNTTESLICGIPPTPVNQTNTTTFTSPSKSLTPSATIP
jgi:hypothetical protein